MRIFLSYRFTGEDLSELGKILDKMQQILSQKGHFVFCSLNEEENFKAQQLTTQQIYDLCLREQEGCDTFLAFIKTEHPSRGMEMELQKSIELGQRRIVLIRCGLDFKQFRENADLVLEFDSYEELYFLLENM